MDVRCSYNLPLDWNLILPLTSPPNNVSLCLSLTDTGNKKSDEVMNGLAKVDDYCGKLHIGIVKINDLELVTEYNLGELPALVYYRHAIPILYEGEWSARK